MKKREKPKRPRKPNDGGVKKPATPDPGRPFDGKSWADIYHAHLDECARCRDQPFNLCPVGARLLAVAVSRAVV